MTAGARVASNLAVTALQAEPTRRSEQITEVLLGEPLTVVETGPASDDPWVRVEGEDGYPGWLPAAQLSAPGDAWFRGDSLRVKALWTTLTTDRGERLGPVLFGSRFVRLEGRGDAHAVMLPRGVAGRLPASATTPFYGDRDRPLADVLEAFAAALAGVPYRWGGRSPWGFDCSGLAQLVLGELGVSLPRDSHLMEETLAARGARVTPGTERAGDILFWGSRERATHVGVALDGDRYLHAREWVRIGRRTSGPDADLERIFRGGYRLEGLGAPASR